MRVLFFLLNKLGNLETLSKATENIAGRYKKSGNPGLLELVGPSNFADMNLSLSHGDAGLTECKAQLASVGVAIKMR